MLSIENFRAALSARIRKHAFPSVENILMSIQAVARETLDPGATIRFCNGFLETPGYHASISYGGEARLYVHFKTRSSFADSMVRTLSFELA